MKILKKGEVQAKSTIANADGNSMISECTFTENESYWGGGIFDGSSSSKITACEFIRNFAIWGGGITTAGGRPDVTDCAFISNSAEIFGGGIYNTSNEAIITNCTLRTTMW